MEGLVKAVGKATAPWWSSTSYEDELDATDAAWVRNGKSDSLDSSEACSPRRRSFGDSPRPIPPLDEDPRGRKPSYEEEVKDASPKKTHDQWTCPQCTFLNVENHGKCGVCGSARPLPPPPPVNPLTAGKAKLGRGSGISLSPDAKRLAALLSVDADTVVVVKPGYEPPPPVKEGLDDAEDDATTATPITYPDLRKEENDSLSKERSLMGARDPCRRRRKWASSGTQMNAARASAHASAGRRVARLGSFCDQSRRSLDALDRRRLAPMALKLRAVCEYFGEPVADDAAAPAKASYVFTTVGAFLRALDGAVAQASRVARREASLQKSLAVTRRASSGDVEVERGERDNRPRRRAHSAVLT